MEDIYIGTPNAKQDEFLRCKKKYVAFGGARGGGKSWAVRCKAKLLAQRYPGIRMLLVRRTMPEIEANHLETLRLELAGTAVYRAEERRFVFGNGSVLQFGYCACDRDADRYQGAEYDVIFFDEATQLKEQWMRKLAACVRGVNGFPKRIYYTCSRRRCTGQARRPGPRPDVRRMGGQRPRQSCGPPRWRSALARLRNSPRGGCDRLHSASGSRRRSRRWSCPRRSGRSSSRSGRRRPGRFSGSRWRR